MYVETRRGHGQPRLLLGRSRGNTLIQSYSCTVSCIVVQLYSSTVSWLEVRSPQPLNANKVCTVTPLVAELCSCQVSCIGVQLQMCTVSCTIVQPAVQLYVETRQPRLSLGRPRVKHFCTAIPLVVELYNQLCGCTVKCTIMQSVV